MKEKYRQRISLLLVIAMLLVLSACGAVPEPAATTAPAAVIQETELPTQAPTEPEIPEPTLPGLCGEAASLNMIPDSILEDLNSTVSVRDMCVMLRKVIALCDESCTEEWNTVMAAPLFNEDELTKSDAAVALYEAACILGMGSNNRPYWNQMMTAYNHTLEFNSYPNVFPNLENESPVEDNMGHHAGWPYITGAMFFAMGQSSAEEMRTFFDLPEKSFNTPITGEEAVNAAYRLYLAYQAENAGSFTLPETPWNEPELAAAKAHLDEIQKSSSGIVKADHFVLGETFTGTAYYVSNSGSDSNDGTSPETAWKTLGKVNGEALAPGDAVFFQCGGIWYGKLSLQESVSYSSYGEGSKPTITGSPLGIAKEENWQLYGQSDDGGQIWKYVEKVPDCGIIILNGGELAARKAYPMWDGTQYISRNKEAFTVESGLFADLMFCSNVDLTGKSLPLMVDGSTPQNTLYFRCDDGNPGSVFDTIEIAMVDFGSIWEGPNTVVDNLNFRAYSNAGYGSIRHEGDNQNCIIQNCEVSWCGGICQQYQMSFDGDHVLMNVSGGGVLLFGSDMTARNNYIHDCENKGIAVVINGGYGMPGNPFNPSGVIRKNIHMEGNVIERCGSSFYEMMEFIAPGSKPVYEDVYFTGNYVIHSGYGWRAHNELYLGNKNGTVGDHQDALAVKQLASTGTVLFSNNLFYKASGPLIYYSGRDYSADSKDPLLDGNTYVQSNNRLFFVREEEANVENNFGLAVRENNLEELEKCVREKLGDANGTVIIK